jgi:hypothetical protein
MPSIIRSAYCSSIKNPAESTALILWYGQDRIMVKRVFIAIVINFSLWTAMDGIIQGLVSSSIQSDAYKIWLPLQKLVMGHVWAGTLFAAVAFVMIYTLLIQRKTFIAGTVYGIVFGMATGFSIGFVSYAAMPMSLTITAIWFLGYLCQATIAGMLTALIVREPAKKENEYDIQI